MKFVIWFIIAGIIIGCMAIKAISQQAYSGRIAGNNKGSNHPSVPVRAEAVCPFCGRINTIFYTPSKERVPALFKCNDCMRYYGYEASMTPEERMRKQESDNACRLVDKMPELNSLINTVVAFFLNYNKYSQDSPIVSIKDGKVEVLLNNYPGRRLIATYPKISGTADQHICFLCYQQLKKEMPYSSFNLGHWFVSKETN